MTSGSNRIKHSTKQHIRRRPPRSPQESVLRAAARELRSTCERQDVNPCVDRSDSTDRFAPPAAEGYFRAIAFAVCHLHALIIHPGDQGLFLHTQWGRNARSPHLVYGCNRCIHTFVRTPQATPLRLSGGVLEPRNAPRRRHVNHVRRLSSRRSLPSRMSPPRAPLVRRQTS